MASEELVSANDFCTHHHIQISFLQSLHEFGLIELNNEEKDLYLHSAELDSIERMMRLHYELAVNFEGIDVIKNLLDQLEHMSGEMVSLKNKLRFYQGE
jgi:cold shock CspA family protein